MRRFSFPVLFMFGLTAMLWVAYGFLGKGLLPLLMTALISAVYGLGAYELWQFRRASASLARVLADTQAPVADLDAWLRPLHPALQHPLRQRIEGERVALPGPALTPYLVGLLVMLGMLGTFLGLVATFRGVSFALEGASDLAAMRAALAAPIKGLGLSFGTSIAGVAASATLGLLSALCRRERLALLRRLDQAIASVLRPFSRAHQRQQTSAALQLQAQTLPLVVTRLEQLATGVERRHQDLSAQLLGQQAQFHQDVGRAYDALAESVGRSLQASLAASASAAGEGLKPVLAQALAAQANEARAMHQQALDLSKRQLNEISARLHATTDALGASWQDALRQQARTHDSLIAGLDHALAGFGARFEQQAGTLLQAVHDVTAQAQTAQAAREAERQSVWQATLQASAEAVQAGWVQASAQSLARHQGLVTALERSAGAITERTDSQVQRTLDAMAQLAQTATDIPLAAAQAMARLQQEMAQLSERENRALGQQTALADQLQGLVQAIGQGLAAQQAAIGALVDQSGAVLTRAGEELAHTFGAQAARAGDWGAQLNASAIELASLGEAFQHGVTLFGATSEKLGETLQQVQAQLSQSSARSDEQLAYYVAQAREVIDLSMSAQQRIVEDLHRLERRSGAALEDAA